MSAPSDEQLVATVAKELLENAAGIPFPVQIAIDRDQEALKLPCIVLSVKFESEEPTSALPKRYSLNVELRGVRQKDNPIALDDIFKVINDTFDPASGTASFTPPAFTASFNYFRIEGGESSDNSQGDTNARSRTYTVFARLL